MIGAKRAIVVRVSCLVVGGIMLGFCSLRGNERKSPGELIALSVGQEHDDQQKRAPKKRFIFDTSTIVVEPIRWSQRHDELKSLLVSNPARAYYRLKDLTYLDPIGGHDWHHLGWTKKPRHMNAFVSYLIARVVEVGKTKTTVNLLNLYPNGRFLDLALLAALSHAHPGLPATLRRYSERCKEKTLSEDGRRLADLVEYLYPNSSVVVYSSVADGCAVHEECEGALREDHNIYDVLFACTGESFEKSEQIRQNMIWLMEKKRSRIGVLLALTREGVVMHTITPDVRTSSSVDKTKSSAVSSQTNKKD